MDRASETGGQFRVIKVIMYNKVLASAVTMQENTHWDQAGAWSKAPPGRLRNLSYISQNNGFGVFFVKFASAAWWARSTLLRG